jgi:hypothetical protein
MRLGLRRFDFFFRLSVLGRPRQGLNRVARKGGGVAAARRGGDLGSHRSPLAARWAPADNR